MPIPYAEVLLQIIHADSNLPDPARLASFDIEQWEALTTEAIRYRLAFQLHEYLKVHQVLRDRAPESCQARLKLIIRGTLMLNLQRQAQLRQMIEACKAEEIPFLVMKGLWVVEHIYRNLSARASGDIDILLKPEDMPRFTRMLQCRGYQLNADISDIRDIAGGSNEFPLPTLDGSSRFDVHWSMTDPREESSINEERIWARASIISLAGFPCQSLCLEDHLLMLCFHSAIHHRFQYVGPRALVDIAEAIKAPPRPIQWDDFIARTHEMGWVRGVWLMLDLVREHLGVQPPKSVLDALRPQDAEDLEVREAALAAMFMDQQHLDLIGGNIVKLYGQSRWAVRIGHVFRRLFPSPDYISAYFGYSSHDVLLPWLYPWLYVRRWIRLVSANAARLAKLARHDPERMSEIDRSLKIIRWLG